MSIYDVFSGGSKPFDKAQWAAQKQEQRKEAYELIDSTCTKMMTAEIVSSSIWMCRAVLTVIQLPMPFWYLPRNPMQCS